MVGGCSRDSFDKSSLMLMGPGLSRLKIGDRFWMHHMCLAGLVLPSVSSFSQSQAAVRSDFLSRWLILEMWSSAASSTSPKNSSEPHSVGC